MGRRHRELAQPHRPRRNPGLDDYFTRDFARNIGAEIMGRNKFGPQRGPWENLDWQGWWGDAPPFHTPVFVLTHHPRPSFTLPTPRSTSSMPTPAEALRQAKEAADGKDVRLGGGVATVREFLEADLVDTMHVAVARSSSAAANGSGTRPTTCSTGSTSSGSRARAASPTSSSGAADPGLEALAAAVGAEPVACWPSWLAVGGALAVWTCMPHIGSMA